MLRMPCFRRSPCNSQGHLLFVSAIRHSPLSSTRRNGQVGNPMCRPQGAERKRGLIQSLCPPFDSNRTSPLLTSFPQLWMFSRVSHENCSPGCDCGGPKKHLGPSTPVYTPRCNGAPRGAATLRLTSSLHYIKSRSDYAARPHCLNTFARKRQQPEPT